MITIQPEHRLIVEFTSDTDRDDITLFSNIIKKCTKESKKSGFKSMFNNEEKEVIKGLNESING